MAGPAVSSGGRGKPWTPQMVRAMLDYIETNKGEGQLFFTNREAAMRGIKGKIETDVPPAKRFAVNTTQIDGKLTRFLKTHALNDADRTRGRFFIQGVTYLDLDKLPSGVYSLQERQQLKKMQKGKAKAKAKTSAPPEQVQDKAQSAAEETEIPESVTPSIASASDVEALRAYAGYNQLRQGPLVAAVRNNLESVWRKTERTVEMRLQHGRISVNQPFVLDFGWYSEGVRSLLEYVTRCDIGMLEQALHKLGTMQAQQHLGFDAFLCSIIGAAVTTWVLEPSPLGPEEPMSKYVLNTLRKVAPVSVALAEDVSLKAYIDDMLRPQIPNKAKLWAQRLEFLLAPMLRAPTAAETTAPRFNDAISVDSTDDTSLYNIPDWLNTWRTNLVSIFSEAYSARLDMAAMGGRYSFRFLRPGSAFKTAPVEEDDAPGEVKDKVVMLTLFPEAKVSVEKHRGSGEWGVGEPISAARVRALNIVPTTRRTRS